MAGIMENKENFKKWPYEVDPLFPENNYIAPFQDTYNKRMTQNTHVRKEVKI